VVVTTIRLGSVSLDCADPSALGSFWANLLGGEVAYTSDDFVAVKLEHMWISALRLENYEAPEWPTGKLPKQMHIDLGVDDLEEAQQHALSLGAVLTDFQPGEDRFRVMLDPAGHPFCLTTQIP
jgi:catechol 2,3-dioxygenase-like lactoylglutathione lyase family enzyme